jgi:hypothetical protein
MVWLLLLRLLAQGDGSKPFYLMIFGGSKEANGSMLNKGKRNHRCHHHLLSSFMQAVIMFRT